MVFLSTHACLQATSMEYAKKAGVVDEEIEDALHLIVRTAERSVKMKKELKQTIRYIVSTLRDPIVKLHVSRDSKTDEISKLEKQVYDLKNILCIKIYIIHYTILIFF